jgi:putative peptidoglycan lipid II flippase
VSPFLNRLISKRHQTISSASLVLALAFGLSALLGVLRNRFLYAAFFKCCLLNLDAYNAAFRIPDLIFKLLVTGALSASFIPVFSSQLKKDPKAANQFASVIINLLLVGFIVVGLLAFIFVDPLSRLITHGFNPGQLALMTQLSRILILGQLFFLLSNFVTAILQVNQIFFIPALSPIIYNLVIIGSIVFLAPRWGFAGVAWGTVAGALLHFLVQIPSLFKTGFSYHPSLSFKQGSVGEVFRLMIPRTLSLGLNEIESTATLFFATSLTAGTLSIFNLALQIIFLPSRIFSTTVGQAALPTLSRKIASNKSDEFLAIVRKTIFQSLFLVLPVTTILLVNRLAVVRLLFGSRHFPWSATLTTAKTLAFLLPIIPCQTIIQILTRCFYALHDTFTPFKIAGLSLLVNIGTAWYLVNFTHLAVYGLAISVSLGNLVQTLALSLLFYHRFPGHSLLRLNQRLAKLFSASIIASLTSWALLQLLDNWLGGTSKVWMVAFNLVISSLGGLIIFFIICQLISVPELDSYRQKLLQIKLKFQK